MTVVDEVETENAPPRSRRRVIAFVAVGALVLAAAVTGIVVATTNGAAPAPVSTETPVDSGDDNAASEEPLTTVPANPVGPLSEDEDAEIERATLAVDGVVAALDEISQRGDGSAVGIESIATGWVLGELQSRAREQFDLGYKQTGTAVVTGVTPLAVDLAASPATISLKVCVDVSGIDLIDSAGNSLKDSLYNPGRPVAHVYGAVFQDDSWKIQSHDIPDTQDCPAV